MGQDITEVRRECEVCLVPRMPRHFPGQLPRARPMFYHTPQGIPGDTCCWLRFLGSKTEIHPAPALLWDPYTRGSRNPCNNLNTGRLRLLPGTTQLASLGRLS